MLNPKEDFYIIFCDHVDHTSATHWPIQGQWWSNFSTQLSHTMQWQLLGGRKFLQMRQYLSFNSTPLIVIVVFLTLKLLEVFASSVRSCSFLRIIPGSMALTKTKLPRTCITITNQERFRQTFILPFFFLSNFGSPSHNLL